MVFDDSSSALFLRFQSNRGLDNPKRRLHLPAKRHRPIPEDRAAKTAFPIHETSNPSAVPESFLLIVRTERIVTTHVPTLEDGCHLDEYRRILGVSSIWPTTLRIVADAGGSTHCTLWEFYLRHICYYLQIRKRLGHFCLAPHVAMRVGLYLHP